MFEKKATEYATVGWDKSQDPRDVFTPRIDETKFNDWRNGAEFGYNRAKEELEEKYKETICNSELNLASVTEQLEELIKKIYIVKVAERYGMVTFNEWDKKFYFEKESE